MSRESGAMRRSRMRTFRPTHRPRTIPSNPSGHVRGGSRQWRLSRACRRSLPDAYPFDLTELPGEVYKRAVRGNLVDDGKQLRGSNVFMTRRSLRDTVFQCMRSRSGRLDCIAVRTVDAASTHLLVDASEPVPVINPNADDDGNTRHHRNTRHHPAPRRSRSTARPRRQSAKGLSSSRSPARIRHEPSIASVINAGCKRSFP